MRKTEAGGPVGIAGPRYTPADSGMDAEVIVIGGGVAGLSCADLLLAAGRRVRIWADALAPETTSCIAAAFWYPYRVAPAARVNGWARTSYAAFGELAAAGAPGVRRCRALELLPAPAAAAWSAALPGSRPAATDELPPGFNHGQVFDSFVIETPRYLPWLHRRVVAGGAVIERRRVLRVDEAAQEAPWVFHCAGLGARETAGDLALQPVRGQLVRVTNPGLDRVVVDEHSGGAITYIVPRSADVILGGTAEEGQEGLIPDPTATAAILGRCAALEPRLRGAELLGVQVGIRPCRPEVRVERERLGGAVVVHNYGHGGAGITLSWGCAREAVELLGH